MKKARTYGRRRRSPSQVCLRPGCGILGCREHCQCPRMHSPGEPHCTRKGQVRSPICSHCRVDETKDCDGFLNAPVRTGRSQVLAWQSHVHVAPQLQDFFGGKPKGRERGEDDVMRWYTPAPPPPVHSHPLAQSDAIREEVTRLQGLARDCTVALQCIDDVGALSDVRMRDYREHSHSLYLHRARSDEQDPWQPGQRDEWLSRE